MCGTGSRGDSENNSSRPRTTSLCALLLHTAILVSLFTEMVTMAVPTSHQQNDITGDYEKLYQIQLSNGVPVEKYLSRKTGMKVILAKVGGPLVGGYFVFATEAHDDDGLPHTLEHLTFLGSRNYPYKGVLDLLANRCLASGTNAWTDTDHTAFTIETAGSEGFLHHLPIYLDHLLFPTLTDAAYMTEVHHVTGTGEDSGVVYAEMQSRENSADDRSYLAMQRAMYSESSGYRYETGGLTENLRNSTTNEKVRAYHRKFYRPENLHLIITGQVEPEELFDVLSKFEDTVVAQDYSRPPFERPWTQPVLPLSGNVRTRVQYPSETPDNGVVLVAWRGPAAVDNYRELLSLEVLLDYLTHSSVSPLSLTFVENDDPLASDVSQHCGESQQSVCYLKFSGVPVEVMDEVEPLLLSTLTAVYADADTGGIDLTEIQEILRNIILSERVALESSPRDTLAYSIIGDALYGNTAEDLQYRVDKIPWYKSLLYQPVEYWQMLLHRYFLTQPRVVVLASPSKKEADRLEEEERTRVEERRKVLGEEGLFKKAEELKEARAINEAVTPSSVLSSIPIPSPESVRFFHRLFPYANHATTTAANTFSAQSTAMADHPSFNLSNLPLRFQLDDVKSDFVTLTAMLDTSSLTPSERLYLPLILELFFESGVLRHGTEELSYESVVRQLSADFVLVSAEMGLSVDGVGAFACGPYCNYVMLVMKFEVSKYPLGVSWLRDVMYHLRPTASRLKVKAARLVNSIADSKRSGPKILSLMHRGVMFNSESNHNQVSLIRQLNFLTELSSRLSDSSNTSFDDSSNSYVGEDVVADVERILARITDPSNITIHMAGDVSKLSQIVDGDVGSLWHGFVPRRSDGSDGGCTGSICRKLNVVIDSDDRVFHVPAVITPAYSVVREPLPSLGRLRLSSRSRVKISRQVRSTAVGGDDVRNDRQLLHNGDSLIAGDEGNSDNQNNHNHVTSVNVLKDAATIESSASLDHHALTNEVPDLAASGDRSDTSDEVTAWVYGMTSVESGYLQQSAPSISQHTHWDLPAVLTAIQYFTQYEGPMWRQIRGKGLTYSYNMQLLPSEGLVTFKLLRASQMLEAYREATAMLRGHINGSLEWEPLLLESAKSSLMFEVIYREDGVSDMIQQSLLSYYRRVPHSYNRELLDHISRVTLEDVARVSKQYLAPLIDPSTSRTVVVCHPSVVKETTHALTRMGHNVEMVGPLKYSRFA